MYMNENSDSFYSGKSCSKTRVEPLTRTTSTSRSEGISRTSHQMLGFSRSMCTSAITTGPTLSKSASTVAQTTQSLGKNDRCRR